MSIRYQSVVKAVLLILAALLSAFVLSKYAASPEFHQKTIEALDEKRTTVMELTAASTALGLAVPVLTVGIPAVLSVYFDLFTGFMQAFIFIMLTMAYLDSAFGSEE